MRIRVFLTIALLGGWAFCSPSSWHSQAHAQLSGAGSPTNPYILPGTGNYSGTINAGSWWYASSSSTLYSSLATYLGIASPQSSNLGSPGTSTSNRWLKYSQNFYGIYLTGNSTYTFTMTVTQGLGTYQGSGKSETYLASDAVLSLTPAGTSSGSTSSTPAPTLLNSGTCPNQVAFGQNYQYYNNAVTIAYTPASSGWYILSAANSNAGDYFNYSLSVTSSTQPSATTPSGSGTPSSPYTLASSSGLYNGALTASSAYWGTNSYMTSTALGTTSPQQSSLNSSTTFYNGFNNHAQNFYSITLSAGTPYTFVLTGLTTTGTGGASGSTAYLGRQQAMSLSQGSVGGTQVGFSEDYDYVTTSSVPNACAFTYTPTSNGTFYLAVSNDTPGYFYTYSLAVIAGQGITFTSAATITVGQQLTLSATGGGSGNAVTFTIDPSSPGYTSSTSTSYASLSGSTLTGTNPGTVVIDAYQAPGGGYASGYGQVTITIASASLIGTTTTITPPSTANFSQAASVVVAVSSSSGTPTGNVTLTVDSGTGVTMALNASGTATFPVNTTMGSHNLNATYAGSPSYQASTATQATLTVGAPPAITIPYNVAATPTSASLTTAGSYPPPGIADTTQNGRASPNASHMNLNSQYQDWYSVTLQAGNTYVFCAAASGSNNDTFLSLQGPATTGNNGTQVCWNDDGYQSWLGGNYCSQMVYTVPQGAGGTYYLIVSYDSPGPTLTYNLIIPSPTPTVTSLDPLPTGATYTSSGFQLGITSFWGVSAAGTAGSSAPPAPTNYASSPYLGTTAGPAPAWVNYEQNWYTATLSSGATYSFTMAITSGSNTPVLALQNGSGQQVQYAAATGTMQSVTMNYAVPTGAGGVYAIICSQNQQISSTSATTPFTLTIPAPAVPTISTTTTITPPASATFTQPASVVVSVTSASGTPTGTVTLTVDSGTGVTMSLNASGTATFPVSASQGTHSLNASYSGSTTFISSTATPATLTVNPPTLINVGQSYPDTITTSSYLGTAADTTLSGTSSYWAYYHTHYSNWYTVNLAANQTYVISTFSANDTEMSLQFNGTQVTYNNDAGLGWLGNSYASQMIYTVPSGAAGTYTIIVTYSSTPSGFSTSGCAYTLLVANPTPTATSLDPLPASGAFSGSYQLSSTSFYGPGAASSLGSPSTSPGSISSGYAGTLPQPWAPYADWWQNWYSVTLTGGATYTFTMSATGVIPVLSLQNAAYGSGATQVAYNAGTTSAPATFSYSVPTGAGGVYYIVCSENTKPASQTTTVSFTLAIATPGTTTTITATTPTSPTDAFVPVMVTAANGAIPTGSVTLTDTTTSTVYSPQILDGTGATTFDITNATGGPHSLSAVFVSTIFQSSTGSATLNIPSGTQTIITAPSVTLPTNPTVTVTVAAEYGTAAPTGSVTLYVDGGNGITMTVSPSSATQSAATFVLTGIGANTNPGHTLTASYAGVAGTFFASQATPVSLIVNPQPPPVSTTTTITTASIVVPNNGSVTVTVTSKSGTPTGSVTLTVDGTALPAQTLVGGTATFTIANPGPGNHTLNASYSGDMTFVPGFAPSNSPPGSLSVGIPNVKLTPPVDRMVDELPAMCKVNYFDFAVRRFERRITASVVSPLSTSGGGLSVAVFCMAAGPDVGEGEASSCPKL
jgi:hypothetical protein